MLFEYYDGNDDDNDEEQLVLTQLLEPNTQHFYFESNALLRVKYNYSLSETS